MQQNEPTTTPQYYDTIPPRIMDFYLNTDNSFKRLLKEYKTYNSLVVAYDFDNTVYDFHDKGLRFDDVIELLRKLKTINCYLIIFTGNDDTEFVKKYCHDHNIPYDAINENPPFFQSESRKIYYNVLLDDRAGMAQVYHELNQLISVLSS